MMKQPVWGYGAQANVVGKGGFAGQNISLCSLSGISVTNNQGRNIQQLQAELFDYEKSLSIFLSTTS